MSLIGKNIKKIRAVKKMSQTDFANLFNISRPSVGAYEDGRAEPKLETIIKIADHFQLSIDTLLTKELTVNELFKFNIFDSGQEEGLNLLKKTDKDDIKEQTPLVTIEKTFDYVVNFQNKDFINDLPVINFPFIKTKKSRAFQLEGAQMEYGTSGLHHKDILLCTPEADLNKLEEGELYVIVTRKLVMVRRFVQASEELIFKPDNPTYDEDRIPAKEILEIWKGQAVFSNKLKKPNRLEERVNNLEVEIEKLKQSNAS